MYPIVISVRSYPEYMRAIIGTHVHTITKVVLPLTNNGCNSDHCTDETEIRSGFG